LAGMLAQRDAPPFEVICVDDASVDATPALLAAAQRSDHRVRVVRGEGRGLVAALNLGLSHCAGGLIARMDADDVVHPDRLRLQVEMLMRDPTLGAAGSLVECIPRPLSPGLARLERWLNETVTAEQCRNGRFVEAPLVHPSATFRREALDGGWEDHGWAEDWDLLLRMVERGWELAKVPRVLLQWRDWPARLTRTAAAYGRSAMFRLRAHYLARGPLRQKPFDIWGAGPTGKPIARLLAERQALPGALLKRAQSESPTKSAFLDAVLELGVPETDLVSMMSEQLGIPGVDLARTAIDLSILDSVPRPVAESDIVL